MTLHDDAVPLRHMRDHVIEAIDLARCRNRQDLNTDRVFELALTKLVENIGEAASRVSLEGRRRHSSIPWREIIGTRHRLIHGYDAVDLDILWQIVHEDLPGLLRELRSIFEHSAAEPRDPD